MPQQTTPSTVADFLTWPGDGRAKRYELVDGQVRAVSPGSVIRGIIQLTLGSMIREHLRAAGSRWTVLTGPLVQPKVRGETNARVPDLGVTCSPVTDEQMFLDQPRPGSTCECSDLPLIGWPDRPEMLTAGDRLRLGTSAASARSTTSTPTHRSSDR